MLEIKVNANDTSVKIEEKEFACQEDCNYGENELSSDVWFIDFNEDLRSTKFNILKEEVEDDENDVACYIYNGSSERRVSIPEMLNFIKTEIID